MADALKEQRIQEIQVYHRELINLITKYQHLNIPGIPTLKIISNLYSDTRDFETGKKCMMKLDAIDNFLTIYSTK
jgi:hypothetical protein